MLRCLYRRWRSLGTHAGVADDSNAHLGAMRLREDGHPNLDTAPFPATVYLDNLAKD
jgi:hypothetical protein